MNKRFHFIFLFFLNALPAMDLGRLYDITQQNLQLDVVQSLKPDEIALMSAEGEYFPITKSAANQSETLKNLIGDIEANKIIPLDAINSSTLKEIVALLNALKKNEDLGDNKLKNRALLDSLEQTTAISDPFTLLAAANYLDIPVILHLAARRIAREEIANDTLFPSETLSKGFKEKWKKLFGTNQDLLHLIARYYFLLSRHKLKNVSESKYGFSVQDYIDYIPNRIRTFLTSADGINSYITLNLSNAQLNSLVGLENIPDLLSITRIQLQNNQLTTLPETLLGMGNLNILDISSNLISDIPIEICNLKKLITLKLSNNAISSIPACIGKLTNLYTLNLSKNRLTEIPDLSNSSIVNLWLNNNRITRMPPSLGAMRQLQILHLENNQIPVSLANLRGFNSLKILRLDRNDFTHLVHELNENNFATTMQAIARIPHLRDLGLQGLILDPQTKDKLIRRADLLQIKLRIDPEQ